MTKTFVTKAAMELRALGDLRLVHILSQRDLIVFPLEDNSVKTFWPWKSRKQITMELIIDILHVSNVFLEKYDIGNVIEVFVCRVNSFHGPCHVKNNIPGM